MILEGNDVSNKAKSIPEAVEMIPDGASIMVGGFMGNGNPHRLLDELVRQGKKDLTLICNDTARPGFGVGKLISADAVRILIATHIGTNPETQKKMISGEITVELSPQGTFAERIRAGGFGLGGVITATGLNTVVAKNKQTIQIGENTYLVELPLRAEFALISAYRSDYLGNLEYELTSRNFNPVMAMAAQMVIVEARDIVPVGVIPPDHVVTPHVLVDIIAGGTLDHE